MMPKTVRMSYAEYNAMAMDYALEMLQEAVKKELRQEAAKKQKGRSKPEDPEPDGLENILFTEQMDIFDFLK